MIKNIKKKEKLTAFLCESILIIGIGLLLLSGFLYGIGFHSVDLSYNMCVISNDLMVYSDKEINYRDWTDNYNLKGDSKPYTYFYILGEKQMNYAWMMGIIGGMFVGIGIANVKYEKKQDKKYK